VDTGAGSGETDLASAGTGRVFRGLDFAPSVVPEPSTAALAALGAVAMLLFRRRK
jgi:hypothetical protein